MRTAPKRLRKSENVVPFWRNVKTIGILAQVIFVLLLVAGVGVLVDNVTTALAKANLPANFSFLNKPSGLPIAERPIPYDVTDTYAKALFIGFLNTLKVALIGVALATIMGVLMGVMRLSANWLVRGISTVYIEVLRNIPLAVQIVFWYSAILLPFPPRISNPVALPGGILLSNIGLAFPALYPTYRFGAWVPYLVSAVVVAVVATLLRKRHLAKLDVVGRVWPYPTVALLVVAGGGFWLSSLDKTIPTNLLLDFNADRGRGVVSFVADDGKKTPAPFVPVRVTLPSASLTTSSTNLVESRQKVNSTFRFPLVLPSEAESLDVVFVDQADADERSLKLHFHNYPSIGTIYVDLNDDGTYDAGEEIDPTTGRGYSGVDLRLDITDFQRVIVADRDGQVRTPIFKGPVIEGEAEVDAAPAAGRGRFSAFGQAATSDRASTTEPLQAESQILPVAPLVKSNAHVPVTNYEGGIRLTVNYLALLLALVIYTSAFIGEIVRGGIQAVPKGQREAANAIGLSGYQTFTLVIFPQAMRIVMPPLISQFLNLTKNSSLASLAGYAELFVIAGVVTNQTGAAIPIALLLVGAYLTISLSFSLVGNTINDRLALVER